MFLSISDKFTTSIFRVWSFYLGNGDKMFLWNLGITGFQYLNDQNLHLEPATSKIVEVLYFFIWLTLLNITLNKQTETWSRFLIQFPGWKFLFFFIINTRCPWSWSILWKHIPQLCKYNFAVFQLILWPYWVCTSNFNASVFSVCFCVEQY